MFKAVIEKILRPAGSRPALFFTHFELKKDSKYFRDISYRFNKEKDILGLIYILSETLKKQGSLKRHFYSCYRADHEDIGEALKEFINFFLGTDTSAIYGKNIKPHGLMQLLPSPQKGSACKRMNLFLRWMVRNMDIDFGIWDKVPPHKLIIPLDTHIAKIARCLGLTKRAASDWNTAKEITESLKKLDRRDPLKYDFALCHQGISGLCRGKKSLRVCSSCAIKPGTLCE